MDELQAAFLSRKLQYLSSQNEARRAVAGAYDELLADDPRIVLPRVAPGNSHAFHIYAVRVKDRDAVLQNMARRGVECAVHYPVPIHLQRAYHFLGLGPGSFPVAERCCLELLSLPIYPDMGYERIRFVAHALRESLSEAETPHRETVVFQT